MRLMRVAVRKIRPLAVGTAKAAGRSITVWFDDELFQQIVQAAERNKCTFAEQVRVYATWALEDETETKSSRW